MGWIGIDLDGTWAEYHGWRHDGSVGPAIPSVTDLVRGWLTSGKDVRVMTARVGWNPRQEPPGDRLSQLQIVREWLVDTLGPELGKRVGITATKDYEMDELWDDRAVGVEKNTGVQLSPSPNGNDTPEWRRLGTGEDIEA